MILSPRLTARPGGGTSLAPARTPREPAGLFSRTVRLELLNGALLLLMVGAMTSIAPGKTAWEAHERQQVGRVDRAALNGVQLTLRVAPAQIGDNEFAVDVVDERPGAQAVPAEVLLRFNLAGQAANPLQVTTQTTDGRRYTARGSYLAMSGAWQIEVILRRSGFNDVRVKFEMRLPPK